MLLDPDNYWAQRNVFPILNFKETKADSEVNGEAILELILNQAINSLQGFVSI